MNKMVYFSSSSDAKRKYFVFVTAKFLKKSIIQLEIISKFRF